MIVWTNKHPEACLDWLGFIPQMLSDADPRPTAAQFNENYAHGGGWRPFKGFSLQADGSLTYPGDPPTRLLYEARLRDELIRVYEHAWVAIVQPDGSFEVSRMD